MSDEELVAEGTDDEAELVDEQTSDEGLDPEVAKAEVVE
jgi:hypothetical protein